jgi:MFS family permease
MNLDLGSGGYDSAHARHAVYRRSLAVVVCSQVFGGAGLAAGVTVGALLAQDMLGGESVAGLPAALFTLGSALTAFGVGRLTQRSGRRPGLATGFAAGAVGAAGIVLAAVLDNVPLLLVCLFVYGAGTATNLQARYAGTDLAPPQSRATAVSIAMVSTTFGAVAGPNLVEPLGHLAERLGIPALAGPFLLAAAAYGLAGLVLFVFLRPDPFVVAQVVAERPVLEPVPAAETTAPVQPRAEHGSGVLVGATVMVLTQVAMVAIMTMTPVQMRHHDRSLAEIGFVISMHIGAMYLPSLVTGRLVDTVGRLPMAVAAAFTLLAAGLVAGLSPGDSMPLLTIGLVLLGLGWNFGLISGTALIVDSTPVETRARTQGAVDVLIAISGAGGGALSGMVVGAASYAVLSLGGGFLSLLLIPVVAWHRTARRADRGAATVPSR